MRVHPVVVEELAPGESTVHGVVRGVERDRVVVELSTPIPAETEAKASVTAAVGLLKGNKLADVVRMGAELGVRRSMRGFATRRTRARTWVRSSARGLAAVAALGALSALAACTPLYLPPVPATVEAPEPVVVAGNSSLQLADDRLIATIYLAGTMEAGWLVFQWYGPSLRQVASDSVWVEPGAQDTRLVLAAPETVAIGDGRWRLVVSFDGVVLRQLEVVVGRDG